jgi:hypothetical protein
MDVPIKAHPAALHSTMDAIDARMRFSLLLCVQSS